MATTTDYDTPRNNVSLIANLEELRARRAKRVRTATADLDDIDLADGYELPGAELLDEELTIVVTPMRSHEFRCGRCFLIRHQRQRHQPGRDLCHECA